MIFRAYNSQYCILLAGRHRRYRKECTNGWTSLWPISPLSLDGEGWVLAVPIQIFAVYSEYQYKKKKVLLGFEIWPIHHLPFFMMTAK